MTELAIEMFPCLADNYGFLVHDRATGATATIDTPDAQAIDRALASRGWRLTHIFNTHHHHDHAGGNLALKATWGCTIVGPRADAARIPGIDVEVGEGDVVELGASVAHVHDTPGHTRGHIVYRFPQAGAAFVGDTLFAMGCGRLFEGTPAQMWGSLQKIAAWPDHTRLYCAHEYTAANARFGLSIDPENAALRSRAREIERLRAAGQPTVPTTLALEKATNPFLRAADTAFKRALGVPGASDVDTFARARALKDVF